MCVFIDYDYDYYGYGDYRGGYSDPYYDDYYRYEDFYFDYAPPPQPARGRGRQPQPVGRPFLIVSFFSTKRRLHLPFFSHKFFLFLYIFIYIYLKKNNNNCITIIICFTKQRLYYCYITQFHYLLFNRLYKYLEHR